MDEISPHLSRNSAMLMFYSMVVFILLLQYCLCKPWVSLFPFNCCPHFSAVRRRSGDVFGPMRTPWFPSDSTYPTYLFPGLCAPEKHSDSSAEAGTTWSQVAQVPIFSVAFSEPRSLLWFTPLTGDEAQRGGAAHLCAHL